MLLFAFSEKMFVRIRHIFKIYLANGHYFDRDSWLIVNVALNQNIHLVFFLNKKGIQNDKTSQGSIRNILFSYDILKEVFTLPETV